MFTYYIVCWTHVGSNGRRDDNNATNEDGICSDTPWFLSCDDAERERQNWASKYSYGSYVVVEKKLAFGPEVLFRYWGVHTQ